MRATVPGSRAARTPLLATPPTAALPRGRRAQFRVASSSNTGEITVVFVDEGVSVRVPRGGESSGKFLTEVAASCGVTIQTGCHQGNCGLCEVEVFKYSAEEAQERAAGRGRRPAAAVVRACVTKLPPAYARLEVCQLADAIWGVDGFDT